MILIELGSAEKWRNKQEYTTIPKAYTFFEGESVEVIDYHNPITKLCVKLMELGADGDTMVEIVRGDTQCFTPAKLHIWAYGGPKKPVPEGFRKYHALRNSE